MVRKITPKMIEARMPEHLVTALEKQNWYSYTEALEDITELVNRLVDEALKGQI